MATNDTNITDYFFPTTTEFDARDPNQSQKSNNSYAHLYHFHGYPTVIPLALLMVAFMVLAVVGNVMVILTIVRHRGMRTRTNMFIVNLAVADILVAVLDMPVSLTTVLNGGWVFGEVLCKLNGFTMALFLICSIHTLMYISIHKYISITRPFSRAMTPKRIKMMIAAAWLWALVCAVGPLVGWNNIVYKKGASQCGPDIPEDVKSKSHSLFITTTNYIIPLVVMSFCYFRIFREIHVHMDRIRETSNINLENSVAQQKKVSVTLFLVLACFGLCWTPFVLYSTVAAFMKRKEDMPFIINPLAYWCGYLNSACNPIIYAFRSPSFRQGYKEIMCGTPTHGLSGVHSLSFRSRSARGSLKSSSNVTSTGKSIQRDPNTNRRQKRMLSQTSWMSLPIMPYLFRSLSTVGGSAADSRNRTLRHWFKKEDIADRNETIPEENASDSDNSDGCCSCYADSKHRRSQKESFNFLREQTETEKATACEEINHPVDATINAEDQNVAFSPEIENVSHKKPPLIRQNSFESEELHPGKCAEKLENNCEPEISHLPDSDTDNWEIIPLRNELETAVHK